MEQVDTHSLRQRRVMYYSAQAIHFRWPIGTKRRAERAVVLQIAELGVRGVFSRAFEQVFGVVEKKTLAHGGFEPESLAFRVIVLTIAPIENKNLMLGTRPFNVGPRELLLKLAAPHSECFSKRPMSVFR